MAVSLTISYKMLIYIVNRIIINWQIGYILALIERYVDKI